MNHDKRLSVLAIASYLPLVVTYDSGIGRTTVSTGNSAANVAFHAANWGVKAGIAATIADDNVGLSVKAICANSGIDDCQLYTLPEQRSRIEHVMLPSGVRSPKNSYLPSLASSKHWSSLVEWVKLNCPRVIHFNVPNQAMLKLMAETESLDTLYSLDLPALTSRRADIQDRLDCVVKLLKRCTYVVASEKVLLSWCQAYGHASIDKSNRPNWIIEMLFDSIESIETVVVTLSRHGLVAKSRGGCLLSVPVYPSESYDETGAGDTLWGTFLAQEADPKCSLPLVDRLKLSSAAAAVTCDRPSATAEFPTIEEVHQRQASAEAEPVSLRCVEITGVDSSVNHNELLSIQRQYPFVEWGVLLNGSPGGKPRYPDYMWIEQGLDCGLNICAHLCGSGLLQHLGELPERIEELLPQFQRIQLNVGEAAYTKLLDQLALFLQLPGNQELILQASAKTLPKTIELAEKINASNKRRTSVLVDPSRGRGRATPGWMYPKVDSGIDYGYTGGLNPGNVELRLREFATLSSATIWVGMETGARDPGNPKLVSTQRIRDFLRKCGRGFN